MVGMEVRYRDEDFLRAVEQPRQLRTLENRFAAIEQTTWKEKDGKFYYDTKVKGEVLGETVDPFAEIPVDENGCLTIAYGTMILERI